jgi:hypothetical protein
MDEATQHLSSEQATRAVELMQAYLAAPAESDGRTPLQIETELDQKRADLIERELKPLLRDYLSDRVSLPDFKTRVDGSNKRNELWGFKGAKGQMFFNVLFNATEDRNECDRQIKAAIAVPANESGASGRIKGFIGFVNQVGDRHTESGGTKQGRPNPNSVPFFLSYFWQVEERDTWPIFYTNSVKVMTDMNLWMPIGEPAADYVAYKRIHEELGRLFTREGRRHFGLYDVEHVFWFKGGNPYEDGSSPVHSGQNPSALLIREGKTQNTTLSETVVRLPESYVPPIVDILPKLARNDDAWAQAARASGTSLERAFEKSINAAFTILGYETRLLGQGRGRVPDGQALDADASYAILWDAKARGDRYSMGTDDRAVREYINTRSRELRGLRNIYYLIVSSQFADDYDDAIRSLKMETDVNEVCLVEAEALVVMVDMKMRSPREITLGSDGLQRLFTASGVLSADDVRQHFE